jgi:catechol-2,3-dioxygenase
MGREPTGEAGALPWHASRVAALAGLHHAALSVRDVDAAADWYRDVFGLEEAFRQESDTRRFVVMGSPGFAHTLGLVEHHGPKEDFRPQNLGLDHLAFSVASREDLDAWSATLNDRNVVNSGPIDTPFGGMLNFTDLNGIALALFWERGRGPATG